MTSVNDVSKNIEILSKFTMFNEEEYDYSIIDIIDDNYSIQINDKKYLFKILSDMDGLINFDKEVLKTRKRQAYSIYRNLRLMFTLSIAFPKLIVGCDKNKILRTLILYNEDDKALVIDYANNIIMQDKDYYELFGFKELNILDRVDLYYLYTLIKENSEFEKIEYYLLYSEEILESVKRKGMLVDGINVRNCLLVGSYCDSVFFSDFDSEHNKIREELDSFTLDPNKIYEFIIYDKKCDKYYHSRGNFYFDLLSNYIKDEELKSELFSTNRYSYCHANSQYVAFLIGKSSKVVGGKIRVGENSYFYHSWVEIDEKNLVLDYNHNLVMNKDDYYKLNGAVAINKTPINELVSYLNEINFKLGLKLDSYMINYFGQELHKDITKNKQLLTK